MMILSNLLKTLKLNNALIVHCARSSRAGELQAKPLYPDDLKGTILDLKTGGTRSVSCSVVWPAHPETFGEIGIIVKPRNVEEIVRISTTDGGTLQDGEGFGEPLSNESVDRTFTHSVGHNEWVLNGGDVVGIFLNFQMGLRVARLMDAPPGMSVQDAKKLGIPAGPYPMSVSVAEVAADFPGLSLFGFVDGVLTEMDLAGRHVAAGHPY